jgi:hypothetical protein
MYAFTHFSTVCLSTTVVLIQYPASPVVDGEEKLCFPRAEFKDPENTWIAKMSLFALESTERVALAKWPAI